MRTLNRRSFLRTSAFGAVAITCSARSWAQVSGANDAIRVGVVGFRGRGGDHINGMRRLGAQGVRLVALCDVDSRVLAAGVESCRKQGEAVQGYTDVRMLLENSEIDAITVATPNHWHSLCSIWACQAGKDVYLEKPISHNVWEGRQAVEAARKYQRIVQTGTQSRSSHAIRDAVAWVQAGNLGKIRSARGLCYKARNSIGRVTGAQLTPPEVDYDLWCGPAAKVPLYRSQLHYDWHWVWNTGNGDLGNQGIHQMDIARWFLGEKALSPAVVSVGGRLGYDDDGETPNTQFVFHDYPEAPLIFEVRGLPREEGLQSGGWNNGHMDKYLGASIGVIVHCEGGRMIVPDYATAVAYDAEGREVKKWSGAEDHYENFIKAVRSRKIEDLKSDILEGHLSSGLCHTGNISVMLGSKSSSDEILAAIRHKPAALETYERMVEHLGANGVRLARSPLTLGRWLHMDPETETFPGDRQANALLTRPYRAPFIVPKSV